MTKIIKPKTISSTKMRATLIDWTVLKLKLVSATVLYLRLMSNIYSQILLDFIFIIIKSAYLI